MAGPYLIGIDGGTEGLRAGVFDLEGRLLAAAAETYPTVFPRPARAEQHPADWWAAVGPAVRRAVADAAIDPTSVAGLCADTTCCSVVALDADGLALRPALIWMDVRAGVEAERVALTDDPALRVNGDGHGPVSAEWMIPKALWLKEHEPEIFDRATTICEYQDYLNFHLTGRMVSSINNRSVRWHYDDGRGGNPVEMLKQLGLDALIGKWPREVLPLGALVGELTHKAAGHLGLPAGLPVAQGGADAFIGMIGLNVVRPGRLALVTGSSHLHLGLSATEFHGAGMWGTYADGLLPGLHVVEGGQTSTGSVVAWLRRLLGNPDFTALNQAARDLPAGSDGLVVLDDFQGNRTPHTDSLSRGAIIGLSLNHGPAHLFRAAIEGIAYGTELILETLRHAGYTPQEIMICGGACRSDLWLQIHADVSGVPLNVTAVPDAPLLGAACLAGVGAGMFPDPVSASDRMVRVVRSIDPNPAHHAEYRPYYDAYKALYPALKPIAHHVARLS
jgi:ribulokinase